MIIAIHTGLYNALVEEILTAATPLPLARQSNPFPFSACILIVMMVVMMMIMTIVASKNMIITSNSSVAKSPLFQPKQKLFPLSLPPYTTVCESDMCVFVCIGGTMRPSVCFEGRGYHREQLSKGGLFTLRYSQKSHNIE